MAKRLHMSLRRFALLFTLHNGWLPWFANDSRRGRGAPWRVIERRPGADWILCCGFTYSPTEIASMVAAEWVAIMPTTDAAGRRWLCEGPRCRDAMCGSDDPEGIPIVPALRPKAARRTPNAAGAASQGADAPPGT